MNILLVNKFHYQRDGVTTHYFDLANILKAHGHNVAFFSTKNANNLPTKWSKYFVTYRDLNQGGILHSLRNSLALIYNWEAKRKMRSLLTEFKPDIVHLHNVYYHLTPAIMDEVNRQGIPMIMTLHDYKLVSPNYNLFLRGKVWERSKPHKFYRAFIDKAIKDSYAKSFVGVLEQYVHFWRDSYAKINVFIAPSNFLKKTFTEYGFLGNIEVLPNPIKPTRTFLPTLGKKECFLYYGRLAPEKGIMTALQTLARHKDFSLVIAGSGPQECGLKAFVKKNHLEQLVTFAGFQTGKALTTLISESKAVLVPSLWYENFPYTILESLAMGKLVIASWIGGIPELIHDGTNGLLVTPGDAESLYQAITRAKKLPADIFCAAAKRSVSNYNPEQFYKQLMALYAEAQKNH